MKSARQIGAVMLTIMLFACGGSDEKAVEDSNETAPLENNQQLAATQPATDNPETAENQGRETWRKSRALSEPTQPVKKKRLETGTKIVPRERRAEPETTNQNHLTADTLRSTKPQSPEKNPPTPPVVSAEEAGTEGNAPAPRPVEEVQEAEMKPSEGLGPSQEQSEVQTVVIPPSLPRRLPTAERASPEAILAESNAQTAGFEIVTLPAGSVIEVRTVEIISSKSNVSGDFFEATLTEDLIADGKVVFGRGSEVKGRLLEVLRPGKLKGRGSVTFNLQEIRGDETTYGLDTNSMTIEAESSKGKDVATVGAATAIGAVLGAVFGGKKGAAVGGATAGGAGTAGVLLSRGKDVEIPAERLFSFRLEKDVEIHLR
jgi:hypothetical protein